MNICRVQVVLGAVQYVPRHALCTSSVRIRTYVLPRRRHEYELVDVRAYVQYGRVRAYPNHFRTRARAAERTEADGTRHLR
jgi:hypothetical protein